MKRIFRYQAVPTLLCFLVLLVSVLLPEAGLAQTDGQWSAEQVLMQPLDGWADLGVSLIADRAGGAHLAWIRRSDDQKITLVHYSYWDGAQWTEPNDVFAADSVPIGWPVLVPDDHGMIHMFWSTGTAVYHTSALIGSAHLAPQWEKPELVSDCTAGCAVPMHAVRDDRGIFHLVFTERQGDVLYVAYDPTAVRPYARASSVSSVLLGETAYMPRIDVDDAGYIHVVWTEAHPVDGTTYRVNYSHSTDGGNTWSKAVELGGYLQADGNVIAHHDNLYAAWNAGVGSIGRFFRQSTDRGATWSLPTRFSDKVGRAGYPNIAVDSGDGVHFLTGQGEYVSIVRNVPTLPIQLFYTTEKDVIEQSRMVVVGGNQLLAVSPLRFAGMKYATKQLDTPATVQSFIDMPDLSVEIITTSEPKLPQMTLTPTPPQLKKTLVNAGDGTPDVSPVFHTVVFAATTSFLVVSVVVYLSVIRRQ